MVQAVLQHRGVVLSMDAGVLVITHPPGWPPPAACLCMAAIVSGGILDIISTACFIRSGLLCAPRTTLEAQSRLLGQTDSDNAVEAQTILAVLCASVGTASRQHLGVAHLHHGSHLGKAPCWVSWHGRWRCHSRCPGSCGCICWHRSHVRGRLMPWGTGTPGG